MTRMITRVVILAVHQVVVLIARIVIQAVAQAAALVTIKQSYS